MTEVTMKKIGRGFQRIEVSIGAWSSLILLYLAEEMLFRIAMGVSFIAYFFFYILLSGDYDDPT